MSRNKRVPIPLPIRGLNTIEPFNIGIDSGYARELTNYYIKDGRLFIRPAVRDVANDATVTDLPVWIDSSTASIAAGVYGIRANKNVYIMDTGALVGALSGTGLGSMVDCTVCRHSDLTMLIGAQEPRGIASPFTAFTNVTGVVPATIAMDSVRAACSHKGRLYYASGTTLDYGAPAQDRGTMAAANTYPLLSLLDNQVIFRIFSITGQNGASAADAFLVVFGNGGKVLVYAGDSPSAANWSLVGSYNMPPPPNRSSFVEIDGDVFISTAQYGYWFRDLLTGGAQSAYENSPSRPIENLWQSIGWTSPVLGNQFRPHTYYLKEPDVIVIQGGSGPTFNSSLVAPTDSVMSLVYSRKTKAFSAWFTRPIGPSVTQNVDSLTYYAPVFLGATSLNFTNSQDFSFVYGTNDIEATWKTPYFAPFEGAGNKVNSVRVWFENTVSGWFEKLRAIFDYSDYNAPLGWYTQSTVTQINPGNYGDGQDDGAAQASKQYHPVIGAQGQGGGVSFQFTQKAKSGSSTTQNQSIYAATAYIEEVGELW